MKLSSTIIVLLLYFFLTILNGCSKVPTSIERDNPNDLESSSFILGNSQNIKTEILNNSKIKISWEDSSSYADYYILRKSLNFSTEFSTIDTIDIDTREYIDSSGEITLETRYSISNQKQQENGNIIYSDTLFVDINFGKLLDASAFVPTNPDSSEVQISWNFNSKWPFIGVVYHNNNETSSKSAIDTLYGLDTYTTPKFDLNFKNRNYEINFFVSEIDLLNANIFEKYSASYNGTTDYSPEITNINIINESEVIIKWNDNSEFEDGFEILRNQNNATNLSDYDVIATLPKNVTIFNDTLNPFNSYTISNQTKISYAIRAFKANSSSASTEVKAQIIEINPEINLSEVFNDSFKITWSTNSNHVNEYILQVSYDGVLFKDLRTFPKNVTSYTGSSANHDSPTFYFRIKTSTSKPSSSIGLSSAPELIEEASFPFEKSRHFRFSKSGNLIAVSRGSPFNPLELGVSIYDLNSKSIIYSKDLLNASIHGLDINESKTRIAVASSTKRSVAVYDFEADTLIYIKNNFSAYDVHFSPDANSIYTNSTRGVFSKHDLLTNNDIFTLSDGVATSQSNIRQLSVSPTGDSIAYNVNGFLNLSDSLGNLISFDNPTDIDDVSQDVRFSTKGTYLSLTNRILGAYIYKAKTNSRYFEFDSRYVSINYNETLVFAGDAYELYLLDLENRKHISTYIFDEIITNVAFSPKENIVAVGTSSGIKIYSLSNTNTLKVLDGNFDLRYPTN